MASSGMKKKHTHKLVNLSTNYVSANFSFSDTLKSGVSARMKDEEHDTRLMYDEYMISW